MARRSRVPTFLQLEAAECGAASLGMVLAHHGRFLPLEELRRLCGVSRDGSKASSLVRAGRALGLEARGLKAEPHHLAELPLPAVAFVNFNHFLVVEHSDGKHVWVNDPASGRRRETIEEFSEGFSGVLLTFVPGAEFVRGDERRSVLASVGTRFAGLERPLWFIVLIGIALVVPGLLLPAFSRLFVDFVLVRSLDGWLLPLAAGMAATALARFALLELQLHALVRVRTAMMLDSGGKLMGALLRLPVAFFEQRFAGEVADRVRLNESLVELLTGKLAQAAASLVTTLFFLVALFFYNWALTIPVLLLALGNAAILALSGRVLSERFRKLSIDRGKLAGARIAGLKDIETFKASGAEDMLFARWTGLATSAQNSQQQANALNAWLTPLPGLLGALITATILVLGGYSVMNGAMSLGELVAYQSLAASFVGPVVALAGFGSEIQQLRSYTERLDDILATEPDPRFATAAPDMPDRLPRGGIALAGVSFGYAPLDPPLVDRLSMEIPPGSRIALVGPSGSGKSTLGKLVGGLILPGEGAVLFDGRPLLEWPGPVLASRLAFVRQEVVLFEGTVRENLLLWDATVPEAAMIAAAKDAEIHHVIAARPGGYDAVVAEGGNNFSGGERQRMEIARALATNPVAIILDEATSALDPVCEQRVMDAIRRRGITALIIAHRLSAVRDCDRIYLLDRGRVAEAGSHAELLGNDGLYARLLEA